jgi:hypothetical protein
MPLRPSLALDNRLVTDRQLGSSRKRWFRVDLHHCGSGTPVLAISGLSNVRPHDRRRFRLLPHQHQRVASQRERPVIERKIGTKMRSPAVSDPILRASRMIGTHMPCRQDKFQQSRKPPPTFSASEPANRTPERLHRQEPTAPRRRRPCPAAPRHVYRVDRAKGSTSPDRGDCR